MNNFLKGSTAKIVFFSTLNLILCSFIFCNKKFLLQQLDEKGNPTENFSSKGLDFSISTEKKFFYFNEQIKIKFQLKNKNSYPVTVYIHKNPFYNFSFTARNQHGYNIPQSNNLEYNSHLRDIQDTFFQNHTATNYNSRAIIIGINESWSKTVSIDDYIDIKNYLFHQKAKKVEISIKSFFYPNPEQSKKYFIASNNYINLIISNKQWTKFENIHPLEIDTDITPKEIVYLALTSQHQKNWNDFFKYISFHDYIQYYDKFKKEYTEGNSIERLNTIKHFREYLKRENGKLIQFEILKGKKVPNKDIFVVFANSLKKINGFKRKYYTAYYLKRIYTNNRWYIVGIEDTILE